MTELAAFLDVRKVSVNFELAPSYARLFGAGKRPVSILRDISFQLPQGAHITLYGHEAAGKSTLLRTLTGVVKPAKGTITLNGKSPQETKHLAAGYVSAEESEPRKETVHQILNAFAKTHNVANSAAKLTMISDVLVLGSILHTKAGQISTAQRLRVNMARAALSDAPLILLDDVVEHLGATIVSDALAKLFGGRTVMVATRFADATDQLALPILLLHNGTLAHHGTIDQIALDTATPRTVDVWVEGLRYDLLRKLRKQAGVTEAVLLPTSEFAGQRLRITLQSARYLPTMYDLVSQAPLVRVQELPPTLNDIIPRL